MQDAFYLSNTFWLVAAWLNVLCSATETKDKRRSRDENVLDVSKWNLEQVGRSYAIFFHKEDSS